MNSENDKSKPVKVLVTGFGPFPRLDGGTYSRNASHEITKLLPSRLNPDSRFNPSPKPVEILNPTAADGAYVRTEYAHIRAYTSALHSAHAADVDLIVHLGMADGWEFVSIERRAYKQTFTSSWGGPKDCNSYYLIKDAAGKTVEDAGECPWGDEVPVGLKTKLDVDELVKGAAKALSDEPLREVKAHEDGGAYCCGFIHYESLANKHTKNTPADVLFCHVPGALDTLSLEAGRDAILSVIGAAVTQILNCRAAAPDATRNAAWARASGLRTEVRPQSTGGVYGVQG